MPQRIRVCVNGMTENEQIRGPVRYIVELVARLDTEQLDVVLIAGSWQKNIYRFLEDRLTVLYFDIPRDKVSRALFYALVMPFVLWWRSIDVYHIPDTNPMPLFRGRTRVVSTIHDTAEFVVPFRFSRVQAIYRRFISRRQAHASDHILTVSEYSRSEIARYLKIDPQTVEVIYNGVAPLQEETQLRTTERGSEKSPYILYVGVLENAKNVDRLVDAFGRLSETLRKQTRLLLVGKKSNAHARVLELITHYGLEVQVEILGYVDDATLDQLYRGAMFFAYLSEYEGFGLPILEAMRYGAPVLTTNKTSLPEVAGEAAWIVESDVESVLQGLKVMITQPGLRQQLSAKGRLRAAEFDWAKTARQTGSAYRRVLQPTSVRPFP